MKKTQAGPAALAALFLASLTLCACGGGSPDSGGGEGAPAPTPHSMGIIRISVDGLGTPHPTATAENLSDPTAHVSGGPRPRVLTTLPCFLQINPTAISSGTFNAGAVQYAAFTFLVRNAQGVSGNGCTSGTANGPLSNITLMGLVEPGIAINNTPFTSLQKFDGSNEPASVATTILPTHGMVFNPVDDAAEVQVGAESLQVFSEAQIAGIAIDPEDAPGSYLLPYGFVVHNVNPALGRTLQGNPQSGQYNGQFTFAVKLPTPGSKANAVYSFQYDLQVLIDSTTRVSESSEEQNPLGDMEANLRALALGSTDLAVLGGAHVAQTNIGDPVCAVRIAGTAASPTAFLANNGSAPSFASAPYNLQNLAPGSAINAGFCSLMVNPTASNFIVSGSQTGKRTGAFGGGGTNLLSFTPATPFLTGEQVSYTLTTGLTSSPGGTHPAAPFVGSFTAGGMLPSTAQFSSVEDTFPTGFNPAAVAAGDFNGDGKPDLAVANGVGGNVSVLLGNGNGRFAAAVGYTAGSEPESVAVADFNGDGKLDLAVVNGLSNNFSILPGNGDGTFGSAVSHGAGSSPVFAAVGDFNGDGKPDLAVANFNGGNVSILLGQGNGNFAAAVSYAAGASPDFVSVGDLNGDGKPDLAVANRNDTTVSILLNNGNGTFAAHVDYTIGSGSAQFPGPNFIAMGDFNGDGRLDLAVANAQEGDLSILLNSGNGAFGSTRNYSLPAGDAAQSVVVGDFNRDGNLDVAAGLGFYGTSILLGDGHGNFPTATLVGSHVDSTYTIAADLNGDGNPDLAIAGSHGGVDILMADDIFNQIASPMVPGQTVATGTSPRGAAGADFNGDGKLDLAVVNSSGNSISILLAGSDGSFAAAAGSPVTVGTQPIAVASADFNGDGKPDLAIANFGGSNVSILIGTGGGGFSTGTAVVVGTQPNSIATGDFNGDGKADFITANFGSGNASVFLGNGSGGFSQAAGSPLSCGTGSATVATGDFNNDGKLDFAVTNNSARTLSIFLGNGSGGFTAATGSPMSLGNGPYGIAVGDFNGDGNMDLAVTNDVVNPFSAYLLDLLLGNGNGVFTVAHAITVRAFPLAVVAADLDGDGKLDLAVANQKDDSASVLIGDGSGNFNAFVRTFVSGSSPRSILAGDFFGTHKLGLAVVNNGDNSVYIAAQR